MEPYDVIVNQPVVIDNVCGLTVFFGNQDEIYIFSTA